MYIYIYIYVRVYHKTKKLTAHGLQTKLLPSEQTLVGFRELLISLTILKTQANCYKRQPGEYSFAENSVGVKIGMTFTQPLQHLVPFGLSRTGSIHERRNLHVLVGNAMRRAPPPRCTTPRTTVVLASAAFAYRNGTSSVPSNNDRRRARENNGKTNRSRLQCKF